ncbi:large conductance mechanosensitive channel protein MscL [Mediannikoviicoccus vaginalis]|uniref:large conductance mechanosensitive channel protein MscL n=1 Tax=Mediannikoviicoccus vaginalis TaxID=2899727 RepID=UPI001F01D06B|nr:large conductance mechanosensitive channel protein MscL [Mediannikoviicoccus vaginalis]
MLKEFKEFAMRGNVMDMAIGVIIAGAFGKIVESIVTILMNIVSAATAGVKFEDLMATVAGVEIPYGAVIQAIINFIIIAFILFLIVKSMNKFKRKEPEADPTTKNCPHCETEIPIGATRCPHCTSKLEGYQNSLE